MILCKWPAHQVAVLVVVVVVAVMSNQEKQMEAILVQINQKLSAFCEQFRLSLLNSEKLFHLFQIIIIESLHLELFESNDR